MNKFLVCLLLIVLASVLSGCFAVNTGSGTINQGVGNGNKTTSQVDDSEGDDDMGHGVFIGVVGTVLALFVFVMVFGQPDFPG